MSDALPDDAWVESFQNAQPRPLLNALQKRLHASTTHVNALAELYKQRAAIEASYSESLLKLAREAEAGKLSGKTGNEWEKGGGEARVWESVVSEIQETSSSHSTLAALLKTDFEQPLRDMPNKIVAWRRIGDQDASLDKTLKEYEKVSGKLQKAKSSKAGGLNSELDQLTSSMSSLGPMVYTTYQRLDEERLKGVKEVVVRWGTIRGDIATRDGERAERATGSMLAWEPSQDVLSVGRRLGSASGGKMQAPSAAPSLAGTPQSNRRLSTVTDRGQDFTPTRSVARSNGPPPPALNRNESSTSGGGGSSGNRLTGGLKSMLGRTKSTIGPRRDRSESVATSRGGRDDTGFEAIGEDDRSASTPRAAPPVDDEGFSMPPSDRGRNPWEEPDEDMPAAPALVPTRAQSSMASGSTDSATPAPAPSAFAQTFSSASAEDVSRSSTSGAGAPKLNLALANTPITEDEQERQAALAKMQQSLSLSAPARRGTTRGRRDVRSTMFGAPGEDGTMGYGGMGRVGDPMEELESPPLTANGSLPVANGISMPPAVARQTSMSSMSSSNPFDSPGLAGMSTMAPALSLPTTSASSGLSATITETLNVLLRSGEPQRVQVTGEIHLSLRNPSSSSRIHIRLTSFDSLEKIAPNPAYLSQVPDKAGDYYLNPEALSSASASSIKPVLFKYQVHVGGGESSILPLILDSAFSCKDGETRMILNRRPGPSTTPISDLTLAATFADGPGVSNVQAKPVGTWSPATRRMTWTSVDPTSTGKIIAKFTNESGTLVPQGVQASFSAEGLVSGLGIEVVDGAEGVRFEEVVKATKTGKYLAEAVVQ